MFPVQQRQNWCLCVRARYFLANACCCGNDYVKASMSTVGGGRESMSMSKHSLHTRTGLKILSPGISASCALHLWQNTFPQFRQWWRRSENVNFELQDMQWDTKLSRTQCSALFPELSGIPAKRIKQDLRNCALWTPTWAARQHETVLV